ncbi:peptidoglycan editing factor PgeF, partial [Thiolapillus sp.]
PEWPAPRSVCALSTTRMGGVSAAPWHSFNLGDHVGDDPASVKENRLLLKRFAGLPAAPRWLQQVHGCQVVTTHQPDCQADACYSHRSGDVCAVLTADCLPVLFCNESGTAVAAAHAGWRGLAAGILERTLACFTEPPSSILAWLGPAIGPEHFEVGAEVRQAFLARQPETECAFNRGGKDKWFADIWELARLRLAAAGVTRVYGGGRCTFAEADTFFSYRRDGQTGRMASLVWLR